MGSWLGAIGRGLEASAVLGAEVPVSARLAPIGWAGVQRRADGTFDVRDAVLGLAWTAVSQDTLVLRFQPGLNLPTGGIGSQLYFTPLSTASVDPYLVTDLVYGGAWLVGATAVGRVSLYDGWDRRRQGAFGRLDLRGARRLGLAVPWVGLSLVGQGPSDPVGAVPSFGELAATLGSVVHLGERWSLTGQLRGQLWRTAEAERQFSGGISARFVVGGGREREGEDRH